MPLVEAKARQSTAIVRESEGNPVLLKALRDGTLTVESWVGALSLEGRVFTANSGVASTGVTFGAGGLDTTEFDLHVAVPAGVAIIPLELNIHYEAYGTALLTENAMQSGSGSITGAGASITPLSSNLLTGLKSACIVTGSAVAGTALTTDIKEIWRDIDQLTITIATVGQVRVPYAYRWSAMTAGVLDVVGPNQQVCIWAASNAGGGFISFKYAELPASFTR